MATVGLIGARKHTDVSACLSMVEGLELKFRDAWLGWHVLEAIAEEC